MGVHADGALCEEVVVPESALYDAGGAFPPLQRR